jgi:archaellum component FlaC
MSLSSNEQKEKKPEPERKLIKFDAPEKPISNKIDEKTANQIKPINVTKSDSSTDAAREELEQRRALLQNMKDFDFMIKKNQEDITTMSNKVESLSKDLDDLVSLYEIVSEQMNPFVGLSKVTKKRLDALENIIKEVEGVKNRIGELELTLDPSLKMKTPNTPNPTNMPTDIKNTQKSVTQQDIPQEKHRLQPMQNQVGLPEKISEIDLDDILNKSLESLLAEQNIDTMINEFFINLK